MADLPQAPAGLDEFLAQPDQQPQGLHESVQNLSADKASEPAGLDEFIAPEMQEAKYGTTAQQVITGLEGIGKGIAGPLAPLAEQALGVQAEDINARAHVNPFSAAAGEIGGLAGSALAGFGLGSTLGKIGSLAEGAATGLGVGKIGSAVVKGAIENLAFQAQEEGSKLLLGDPNQSTETAIADMGLATLIGGAFGTVPALWNAAMGTKTASTLKALANKVGGIEGVIPDAVQEQLDKTGIDMAPAVKAGLSDDPYVRQTFSTLEQTDTSASGREFQKNYNQFKKDAGDALITSFDKTPEEVASLGEISKYDAGKSIGNTLADEFEQKVTPIAKAFDDLKSRFKNVEISPDAINDMVDKISKKAINEGWTASPSSDVMREVNRVLKELPLQKNLKNLGDYITQVGNNTSSDITNGVLRRAGGIIKGVLKDTESNIIGDKLGSIEGPQAIASYVDARKGYAAQSAIKDAIDDRLHINASTSGYAKALRTMSQTDGEAVLRRLSGVGDANLLEVLQKNFPETANALRNYHVNDLMSHAAGKADRDFIVSNSALLNKYNKLSPELKNFVISPQGKAKLTATEGLLNQLKDANYNFSNTARSADKLLGHLPGSAIGIAAGVFTHNPIIGALTGYLSKVVGKDIPDAMRYSLLKFLGTAQHVDAPGFRTMATLYDHILKGDKLLSKSISSVFSNAEFSPALATSDKERGKIERIIADTKKDPDKLMNIAGKVGSYLPDHATHLTQMGANAINYLDQQRPKTDPQSPLDSKRERTPAETSQYNRVLDIANQPLTILKSIKNGSITPSDINVLKSLYPALYNKMSDKLTEAMMTHISKDNVIPYSTRIGISHFLGQAMDSTMTPMGIISAQPKPQQNQQQTATQPASKPKHSANALNKLPSMYNTPGQEAERDRANRH